MTLLPFSTLILLTVGARVRSTGYYDSQYREDFVTRKLVIFYFNQELLRRIFVGLE